MPKGHKDQTLDQPADVKASVKMENTDQTKEESPSEIRERSQPAAGCQETAPPRDERTIGGIPVDSIPWGPGLLGPPPKTVEKRKLPVHNKPAALVSPPSDSGNESLCGDSEGSDQRRRDDNEDCLVRSRARFHMAKRAIGSSGDSFHEFPVTAKSIRNTDTKAVRDDIHDDPSDNTRDTAYRDRVGAFPGNIDRHNSQKPLSPKYTVIDRTNKGLSVEKVLAQFEEPIPPAPVANKQPLFAGSFGPARVGDVSSF
jgi:hypothetical protein